MQEPPIPLSERLTRAREALGLTQEELSTLSGVPQETISRIEGGKTKRPRTETLQPLTRALGRVRLNLASAWMGADASG